MNYRSYKDLKIYQIAHKLAVEIYQISLKLPKFETYEEGSQIRRSSKSICSNIVEGFGRRRYKNEFIQFLAYALASCDETREHLDLLWNTAPLKHREVYKYLSQEYEELGKKLTKFIQAVEIGHLTYRTRIQDLVSSIQKKGQALLFVIFLLLIVGILGGALAVMWQAEIKARGSGRNGLRAFYLAQAGIEHAKIYARHKPNDYPHHSGWINLQRGRYEFTIRKKVGLPPDGRILDSTGQALDPSGNPVAERQIEVEVQGIGIPAGPHARHVQKQVSGTWHEQ